MATQNAQMAHKVEVVDEVKTRMGAATASIVSEYRGLTVAELADLRHALAAVGGDYKIFKNTLVRRAIDGGEYQPLEEYLSGPSALTFVQGDISAVAKALRDFSRANPHLVIKGGLADGSLLSTSDLAALADLPPREVLLARLAGALAAPMTADGRAPQGAAAEPGLRDLGADRAEGRCRRGRGRGRGSRPRPRRRSRPTPDTSRPPHPKPPRPTEAEAAAPAAAGSPRGSRTRSDRGRPRPPPKQRRRPKSRLPSKSNQTARPTPTETEGKKGRPRRWQP